MHRPNFEWKIEESTLNLLQPDGLKLFLQGGKILFAGSA